MSDEGWTTHDTSLNKSLNFQTLGDKLPLPVTLGALEEQLDNSSEDAYTIGEYQFSTVQTVGIITEYTKESGQTHYVCKDPENSEKTLRLMHYGTFEDGGSRYVDPDLEEDVRVKAIGKIKNVNGEKLIMVYYLQTLPDDKDFEIFKLESQVAQLFFRKNLIEKMRCNKTEGWHGMLAPPLQHPNAKPAEKTEKEMEKVKQIMEKPTSTPKIAEKPVEWAQNVHEPVASPVTPKTMKQEGPSPKTTPPGLKSKICAIIRNEAIKNNYGESSGVPVQQIAVRCGNLDVERLCEILKQLEDEGRVYLAQENEYMSL